ncbi:MAG: M23 family metallopeptidase [Candidatus Izemoplasmatales bacterium]|jgi:murein DD-endopeptidase MepM/ murein hydrolase activator NlpD
MEKLQNPLKCNLSALEVNTTLHGRSKYRPANVDGHNVVTGWYIKMDRDAIDWFINAGTPVYAAHSGYVADVRDPDGTLACVIITGTGSDKIYRSVYAHLHVHQTIHVGDEIKKGQIIGWVGRKVKHPHLHFELWKNGNGICAPKPKQLSEKLATFFA